MSSFSAFRFFKIWVYFHASYFQSKVAFPTTVIHNLVVVKVILPKSAKSYQRVTREGSYLTSLPHSSGKWEFGSRSNVNGQSPRRKGHRARIKPPQFIFSFMGLPTRGSRGFSRALISLIFNPVMSLVCTPSIYDRPRSLTIARPPRETL